MTDLGPETVGKLVALVRGLAEGHRGSWTWAVEKIEEARAIVAELPEPVDPLLIQARELAASTLEDQGEATKGWTRPASIRKGLWDHATEVTRIYDALRALAAGDRS